MNLKRRPTITRPLDPDEKTKMPDGTKRTNREYCEQEVVRIQKKGDSTVFVWEGQGKVGVSR